MCKCTGACKPEKTPADFAKDLLNAARKSNKRNGIDRIFCIMVDEIPTEMYEKVNAELEAVGSALRLWQ